MRSRLLNFSHFILNLESRTPDGSDVAVKFLNDLKSDQQTDPSTLKRTQFVLTAS
jgi:hypothetical protein